MSPHTLRDRIDQKVFNAIYTRSLVYNACWEDPAVDRIALKINPEDIMLVITSAGCNVLDYALAGPKRILTVDANPRQTALLELKIAGIRHLEFADFFKIFGDGIHPNFSDIYREKIRADLSPFARHFWDERAHWFSDAKGGFYFQGLSGTVAKVFRTYLRLNPKLASGVSEILAARTLDEQRHIYENKIQSLLWGPAMNWALSRQFTMNFLGVPFPQRKEVQAQHANGIAGFIRESVEYVFLQLPVATNYFWSVYIHGHYTPDCCPEYLKPDNFEALKNGLVDNIEFHTCTVTELLKETKYKISKFVLLDHMDWMSSYYPDALAEEWSAIIDRAGPNTRIIFRSAHATPSYLDNVIPNPGEPPLHDRLRFHPELAEELQTKDRVHTYAGFHIADLITPQ
ncbi:S-adenosylmethionine:diacylglycerol 3-amino-3-carboxypropyl transferase [Achromatium sp. WMS2]|nr:S-adenosylmethionine:diacylglycerol 3-amino-3-carboxypropyl transferase [Achromatium sp. WMS2]